MEDQISKSFENSFIRTAWNEAEEEWYFSVVDVVGVLTESIDYQAARNYWKVLKIRLKNEGFQPVTNCNQLKMKSADGKMRLTDVANTEQLLRLIQSIPSKKVEPFKMWLAQVGRERGGRIAGNARKELEAEIGHTVISEKDATQINTVVTNLIEDVSKSTEEK